VTDLFELSERILSGGARIEDHHPFSPSNTLVEASDGVAFVESFANVSAFGTDDGLCLVDTGSLFAAGDVHRAVRSWSPDRLHTAVYTHGHIDHVFGTAAFEEEGTAQGWPDLRVVAHEAVDERFDRYVLTAGYNAVINQRQFRAPNLRWPVDYRRPDETYRERVDLDVGGLRLELHHARGETDDTRGSGCPRGGCSARATSSSGARRTPAIPRRCSATRGTGRSRSARCRGSGPSSCSPATACRSGAPIRCEPC
jgi:hypothetical protein